MERKPIIGISGNILTTTDGVFAGYPRAYVNHAYVESVIKAGGIPFIIPFNTNAEVTKEQMKVVDGLILSGGHDVFPQLFGEEPKQNIGETFLDRDNFDILLLKTAVELKKPVLGICRGHQVINVAFGGSLYQDLSYNSDFYIKHSQLSKWDRPTHTIDVKKESFLGEIFGNEGLVNSFHHQVVNKVADNFKVTARSKDGAIEALESISENRFIVGIQWHPESMIHTDKNSVILFEKFINRVKFGK
ncbi:gamma-glutamyl-gamma-aminobutyrate hydrolase family protein [Leptotrichia sp. OH3620_COT-345]|uniref:gamma-glutamyl-gamma-aminobutyrate hydrolase family protein n=1 Tax=Leptotrichia sp. OH3620_COT-345 TaxID=2491048 RepID=UPI000F651896|nr:gamma-glutamyl-gamma-aminobutyrate hydrolase family protein [Leptotrichia sp. OH3620_COT-345]RRD39127.1 gamma-glutamyl-gamma-aminobutyrate hydrolase family protein [Leptotrichia sp. OH3620_COT-345]